VDASVGTGELTRTREDRVGVVSLSVSTGIGNLGPGDGKGARGQSFFQANGALPGHNDNGDWRSIGKRR